MSKEEWRQNVEQIIEAIKSLPDVVEVQVRDGDGYDYSYEKKATVVFAGNEEEVIVELF